MKNFGYLLTVVCVLVLSSCNKDFNTEQESTDQKILHFDSYSHLQEELSSVLKMTTAEKANWATKKGFTSFGVEADLFYDNMDADGFRSKEELLAFINNSKYLEIETQENEELFIEAKNSDNRYRYFVNQDQIFTVGDKALKVFGEKTLATCIDDVGKLKEIEDIGMVADNPDFEIYDTKREVLKSVNTTCGNGDYDEAFSNDNVYKLKGEIYTNYNYNWWTGDTYIDTGYKISHWKKNLGIWSKNEKTLTYDIHLISRHVSPLYGNYHYTTFHLTGSRSAKEIEDNENECIANYNYNPGIVFTGYLFKVRSTAIPADSIYQRCNY